MSRNVEKIYLGYEDELIHEKYKNDVTYATNKIGGQPTWPPGYDTSNFCSKCVVCELQRALVLQCYAPLPESPYHRTLYIFACINPPCWNNMNSWSCYRRQYLDPDYKNKLGNEADNESKMESDTILDPWCSGADEWDDGNSAAGISNTVNVFSEKVRQDKPSAQIERMSDSEDEDCEMDLIDSCVNNMKLSDSSSKGATAEIEENDSKDVISVDLPRLPKNNLLSLLSEVPDLPEQLKGGIAVQFIEKFITVDEEYISDANKSDHVNRLLEQYKKQSGDDLKSVKKSKGKVEKSTEIEEYEKDIPLHGNKMFYNFLTRIQMNPSQILRYSFGGQPLPVSPIPSSIKSKQCSSCGGTIVFELQLLSTIIPSLKIPNSNQTHLEFGTVLIYTCKKSCWNSEDKIKLETVYVQAEPS